jgi:Raf kinase inhibitor-like YbhB/YbcL family protein
MKKTPQEFHYKPLEVSSPAFNDRDSIPDKYTCDGLNISPPLVIEHIPDEARSLVLVMDDPDAPHGTFVHWVMWNIPVTHHILENDVPGIEGMNDFGRTRYGGPCPPSGTHRYYFKIYALDDLLELPSTTDKAALEEAIHGHVLAFGETIGLYRRKG